jgi:hypothetical protein
VLYIVNPRNFVLVLGIDGRRFRIFYFNEVLDFDFEKMFL